MKSKEYEHPHVSSPNGVEELWDKMRFINPKLKLIDFEEEVRVWGVEDVTIQTNIHLKWRLQMMKMYGGDGLSYLRYLWKQNQTGVLDNRVYQYKNIMSRTKTQFNQYILNR